MKSVSITGTRRSTTGKRTAKAIRKEGKVPCVIYGGSENIAFEADEKDFRHIIYTPEVYSVNINLDGTQYDAVIQETQFHPVKDNLIHVDFLRMTEKKDIKVDLPVKLEGSAAGVKAGGKLILKTRKLTVRGTPENLPEHIIVNVENLEVGGTVKVKELQHKGIEFMNSPNVVVASVKGKRVEAAAEATPAAGAAAEKKK